MNSMIDYGARAETIRGILEMQPKWPECAEYVEDATLELLHRAETGLAESLVRGGVSPEAAAHSAFCFVQGCVEAFRACRPAKR